MSSIHPREVAEGYRLSPPQLRHWRLQQADPDVDVGVQIVVRAHGPLDVTRLGAAVARVRGRHDILRARVARLEGTGVPVQVADDDIDAGLDEIIDLGTPDDARAAAVEEIRRTSWRELRAADRDAGVRFALVRLAEQAHELIITAPALCADAPSLLIVARAIASEYATPTVSDDEALQYADLSEWQNQMLEEPPGETQTPYWKEAAFSELSFPRLPFECRHQAGGTAAPAHLIVPVPADVTTRLRETGSLRATLFAAWGIVLHRLSRSERFLIGVQVDCRSEPELRDAVGPLARTLPIAVDVERHATPESLAAHLQRALAMAEYDQFLFSWEPFGVPGPLERRHLFPVVLRMREQRTFDVSGPVSWDPVAIVEQLESCDLAATLLDTGVVLQVELSWSPARYALHDMRIAAELYVALLERLSRGDAGTIRDLSWPTAGLSIGLTSIADGFCPVHEQIAAHARRAPQAVAVMEGAERLTYGALVSRAATLSSRLRELGVGRETVVAIVSERSIAFIVGMLAVLQAGAAWLPIEPDTPAERMTDMIAQAGAVAVLRQRGISLPPGIGRLPVRSLHPSRRSSSSASPTDGHGHGRDQGQPPVATDPHDLAYVIFTSGSTGRPKGVAIEHGQLAAYFRALLMDERVRDSRHFALVSTIAADLGHTSVFGALCTGGCLHIVSRTLASDADALAAYFRAHAVDCIKIVPAHLDALCSTFPADVRLPWRCAVVGGEQLSWNLVDLTTRVAPDCTVINEYGPTETAIGVLTIRVDRASEPFLAPHAPIGTELRGANVYVLDPDLRPLPPWLEGELFIGGTFVGRGYVGRGDPTAERFIPDPFNPEPGSRMYRTGDRARRRSDGALEFLGRRDGQVKIRGYRIELEEIEAALGMHPDVQMAAARAVEGAGTGSQLVAWAAVGDSPVEPATLQAFLATRLPSFMIPAAIVCLDRFALTPNGKVDRQALPLPAPQAPARLRPPADDIEWQLVKVWQEVLNVPEIGVDDNYFALGGDSLRVIQLVHEARRFGITITAVDVLRHQTVRKLRTAIHARHLEVLFPEGPPPLSAPPPVESAIPDDVVDAYPLSGMQRYMLEEYDRSAGAQGVFHIQECLRLTDEQLSLPVLERAFDAVVDRHPVLRTVFDLTHEPPRQLVRRRVPWVMRRVDLSGFDPGTQDALLDEGLREDRRHRFDATDRDGPHFRVTMFERSATDVELSFSAHHALLDGWGHRVMVNQLFEAYADLKAGREPSLGTPDTTYREFVTYQNAISVSTQASAFWRRYLEGIDTPRPARRSNTGAEQIMIMTTFGPELRDGLIAAARQSMISLKALVLGCWLHTLHEWSGQPVVTTGAIANGRSEYLSDPISAVGMFWNIVPLVSRTARPPLEQALAVQADLNDIEPHVIYPMPHIIADLGGREPFWSCFRYLHFWNARQPATASGLQLADIVARDRYSFPLDCTTLLNTWQSGGWIILQYDPETFVARQAQDVLDRYRATLHEIAARATAVTA